MSAEKEVYPECKHLKREVPDLTVSQAKRELRLWTPAVKKKSSKQNEQVTSKNWASYADLEMVQYTNLMPIKLEVAEHIGSDYRTLPIFEKGLFEYAYTKHYSLQTNEFLKCRWTEYKRHIEARVFAPFQFLDIRDYHFYNCRNQLIPAVSIHTKTDFRKKLKPGPGVDFGGQMPIPQEHHMKRGEGNPRKLPKRYSKDGKEVKIEKVVKEKK